jgi:hypothetical protein
VKKNDEDEDVSIGGGPLDDTGVRWGRYVLASMCIAAALARGLSDSMSKRLDWQFVLLIAAAGAMLLLPYLSKVKFSKGSFEWSLSAPKVRKAIGEFGVGGKKGADGDKSFLPERVTSMLGRMVRTVASADQIAESEKEAFTEIAASISSDDPQKGQWGGQEEASGYRLGARVDRITTHSPDWFRLQLAVARIDKNAAQGKRVCFHLHPTFLKTKTEVPIEKDEGTLDLVAWGAFTVGAEVFDAQNKRIATLELDLSKLATAPKQFRER